jgi:hypothetical protein
MSCSSEAVRADAGIQTTNLVAANFGRELFSANVLRISNEGLTVKRVPGTHLGQLESRTSCCVTARAWSWPPGTRAAAERAEAPAPAPGLSLC